METPKPPARTAAHCPGAWAALGCVAALASAGTAVGQVSWPAVVPASPLAHEPVDAVFIRNSCDLVQRIETRDGGFRLVLDNNSLTNPFVCDSYEGDRVALGSLPPGRYRLEVGQYALDDPTRWLSPSYDQLEFVVDAGPPSAGAGGDAQGPDLSGVWVAPAEPYTSFQIVHSRQYASVSAGGGAVDQVDAAWYTYGDDGRPTWYYVIASGERPGLLRYDGRVYRVQLVDTAPPSGTRRVALTDLGPAHFRFSRFVTGDRFVATIGATTYDLALERYRWVRGGWSPSRTASPPAAGMVSTVDYVVPAAPLAHEPVDLMFLSNDCNLFRRIEPRTGGFRLVMEQVAPNPFLCDTVSFDYRVALGSLPPGNYSVALGSYDPPQSDNWRSFRRIEFAVSPGPQSDGSTAGYQGPDWSGVWSAPAEPHTSFQVVHSRQPGTVDAGGRSIDQVDAAWYTYGDDGQPTWYYIVASGTRGGLQHFEGRVYRVSAVDTASPSGQRRVALADVGAGRFEFTRRGDRDRFVATIEGRAYDLPIERFRWIRGGWSPTSAPPAR